MLSCVYVCVTVCMYMFVFEEVGWGGGGGGGDEYVERIECIKSKKQIATPYHVLDVISLWLPEWWYLTYGFLVRCSWWRL